jgi:tetratricopeptide (TPR) repeat protein
MANAPWDRVYPILDQVLAHPEDDRPALLSRLCGTDRDLRAEVELLLAHDCRATQERFLTDAPFRLSDVLAPPCGDMSGRKIGPYEIARRLGSGGMGAVFLARRVDDYRLEVAVKFVRADLVSEELLERFRRERQVLAGLQHPNIARLLDGGTADDGRPYFVMEYIAGEPITRYCESNQLGHRARARLFHAVCLAVHHVHSQGILHRDLKPSNILVTADGTPHLTDFGLAKVDGEDAGQTQTGLLVGTPCYMAPEQAAGGSCRPGPRADLFTLGVVLYELLTGRLPFQGTNVRDTLDQIATREPVAPSRLAPAVPRDLETICLRCLQKSPSRRYGSASELADDLRRFLGHEPIRARPVSTAERLGRWCRRNPKVAGLAAALLAAVVGGFATVAVLWRLADARGKAAESRERLARRVLEEIYVQVAEKKLAQEPGMQKVQRDVLRQALAFYRELLAQNPTDRELRYKTSQAHFFLGRVEGNMGHRDEACAAYRAQMSLLEGLLAEDPHNRDYRFDLFFAATALTGQGDNAERERLWGKGLACLESLCQDFPDEPNYRDALANHGLNFGEFLQSTGRVREAEQLLRASLASARQLCEDFPDRKGPPHFAHNVVQGWLFLAGNLYRQGRLGEAEEACCRGCEAARRLVDAHPGERAFREELSRIHFLLGDLHWRLRRTREAEAQFQQALALCERLAEQYPHGGNYRHSLAMKLDHLGHFYTALGRPDEAETVFRKAISILGLLVDEEPRAPEYRLHLARILTTSPRAGVRDPERALRLLRGLPEGGDEAQTGCAIGCALYRLNRHADAAKVLEELRARPGTFTDAGGLYLAMAYAALHRAEEARRTYEETIKGMGAPQPNDTLQFLRAEAAGKVVPAR